MEKSLISIDGLKKLYQSRKALIFFVGGLSLFWLLFTILVFLFQTRSTQTIWIVAGTIVTSLWLIVLSYVFIKMMAPLKKYTVFSEEALSRNRLVNDIKISEICKDIETYKGFKTCLVKGVEIDDGTTLRLRYEATSDVDFGVGKTYEIESYDDVIVAYKEIP